ncbi:MAG: nucleoside-triphosphatase [Bacteroidota bacterium]
MNSSTPLSEKWLKASVIGTVWASSEIVLGSFLHNLKVPFSGSILTAIGVILLISASYIWAEKGVIWRAGLICSLMKTMSPSAVIFGPMIAIFAEAVLLDYSIRFFGKNYFGFILGSILAVSWGFAQKIINYLIFYGFNIVELYKNLMQFTENQLNISFSTLWLPLFILLSVYVLIGLFAALAGIKTGKKLKAQPIEYRQKNYHTPFLQSNPNSNHDFRYSIASLVVNILLIVTLLLLISLSDWKIWSLSVIAAAVYWVTKYKRALRQLLKPKFWIFFVLISMLAAFLFTRIQSKPIAEAILIGLEMNFRATVIILGFSVIGKELYNPKIRNFFSKTRFRQLPVAMELATESLPGVVANIPDLKTILKNPVSVIYQLLAFADFRLKQLKEGDNSDRKVFIIKGKIDGGKTTFVKHLIDRLKQKNIRIGGIYSEKIFENDKKVGYDLVNIKNKESKIFLRKNNNSTEKIGDFSIFHEAIREGNEILKPENNSDEHIVIIDEVGLLELNGNGWATRLNELTKHMNHHLLIAVRDEFAERIIRKWNFKNLHIYNVSENNKHPVAEKIIEELNI